MEKTKGIKSNLSLKSTLFSVEEVAKFILDNKVHLKLFEPNLFDGDTFVHNEKVRIREVQKLTEVVQAYHKEFKTYPTSEDREQIVRFMEESGVGLNLTIGSLEHILKTPIEGLDHTLLHKYCNSLLVYKVFRDMYVKLHQVKAANQAKYSYVPLAGFSTKEEEEEFHKKSVEEIKDHYDNLLPILERPFDVIGCAKDMMKVFMETVIPDEREASAADFSHWCLELLPEDNSLQREFLKMSSEWSVFNDYLYTDETKKGPWEKGQMTVFVLGTGEGKTTLCANIGASLVKSGYHVAIVGTEGSTLSLYQKVYCPMYDITKSHWASLSKKEKIDMWSRFQNNVSRTSPILQPKIFFAGSGNKFNNTLQQIKDVEKQVGIPFDAVFFDYPDEMDPSKDSDQDWLNKRQIYKEINKAAEDNNWHVFIPQQYNRGGLQNTSPTMADLGGSIDSAKKASNVFLCHTWKEPLTEELKTSMQVAKFRPNGSLKSTTFTLIYDPATDKLTPESASI